MEAGMDVRVSHCNTVQYLQNRIFQATLHRPNPNRMTLPNALLNRLTQQSSKGNASKL